MKAKEWFGLFARGTTLGTGILPGVSVGTVGIIVNVYDKLLNSIDGLRKKKTFLSSLWTLIPIGVGCLLSTFLLILFWDKVAYAYFPFVIIAVLAGFVIGALPIITVELQGQKISWPDVGRIALGFVFAAGIGIVAFLAAAGIVPLEMEFSEAVDAPMQNPWIFILILVVGFFSAFSCLVPGISGAMVLFIFGLYNPVIDIFLTQYGPNGEIIHPSVFRDTSKLGGGILVVLVLLVGMLIGFLSVSKLMKTMLEKHRRGTFGVVLGFILGSVVSMFLNNDMYFVYATTDGSSWWQYPVGGVLLLVVLGGTYALVRRAQKRAAKPALEVVPESAVNEKTDDQSANN